VLRVGLGFGLALRVAVGALVACPASAQHPLPNRVARPLHERLAQADAAAHVRVEHVAPGRLTVLRIAELIGRVPERFEVKRSPIDPPPLAEGTEAIVLLEGARPPYVLVDEPHETIRIDHGESAVLWSDALRAVHARASDEGALAELYVHWADDGPSTLTDLAMRGLLALGPDPGGRGEWLATNRARVALDPARSRPERHAATLLAARHRAGLELLLERIDQLEAPQRELTLTAARQAGLR
jgi:hypothetical protein